MKKVFAIIFSIFLFGIAPAVFASNPTDYGYGGTITNWQVHIEYGTSGSTVYNFEFGLKINGTIVSTSTCTLDESTQSGCIASGTVDISVASSDVISYYVYPHTALNPLFSPHTGGSPTPVTDSGDFTFDGSTYSPTEGYSAGTYWYDYWYRGSITEDYNLPPFTGQPVSISGNIDVGVNSQQGVLTCNSTDALNREQVSLFGPGGSFDTTFGNEPCNSSQSPVLWSDIINTWQWWYDTGQGSSIPPSGTYTVVAYENTDNADCSTDLATCESAPSFINAITFTVSGTPIVFSTPPPTTISHGDLSMPSTLTSDMLASASDVVKDPGLLGLFVVAVGIPLAFYILRKAKSLILHRRAMERIRDLDQSMIKSFGDDPSKY